MSSVISDWDKKKRQQTSFILSSKQARLNYTDNQINNKTKTNDDSQNDSDEYLNLGKSTRRTVSIKIYSSFISLLI